MWLANFENASSISSKNTFWTQLKEKASGLKMTGVQLSSPQFPTLALCLSDLDKYYFVTEAVATMQTGAQVVAEIIGGHDLELGIGLEIRLETNGTAKFRRYRLERYKYSPDILVEGMRKR